ncbi:tRNA-specific adenosine deaminase KNAG_0I00240 [Huiozyma naganishii CBS 8797]|uniref:A to I editase domain-containing protein n=1 Tax=Huiozyma naganishii (strain ATCC MYA-139 / BCRC 22969 / CBS 8797 / KCTC 17520 / NBRC 10181 / NCYC 3082 / Yp74L-3) TaxID=1071383 RepID=J7RAB0_HUIN7|nr:hypothetical protein KNAG_0I00240 [Kazachstania naganishii CBS 8797]CCK71815.1 hypothetical protein KNAG_0I00240 [Kazachstania naganishii CBS 8797]
MTDLLGNEIADLVYSEYDRLSTSSKPAVRSNGTKEWTILSGLVAVPLHPGPQLRLISLTTGVKATPNQDLERSQGRVLHDCHAEILALRGFNYVLLRQMQAARNNDRCDLILPGIQDTNKFRLNPEYQLALFISRLPCGDGSMNSLQEQGGLGQDTNGIDDDDPVQYIDPNNRSLLRGRFNYAKKGCVRTKPGRMDSKITYSKSCSDKLCCHQATSILNACTWPLIEEAVYIDYLIVPNISASDRNALERCFTTRLSSATFPVHKMQILSCGQSFADDQQDEDEQPSSISCVKLYITEGETLEQAVLSGIRNGFFTKVSKPLRNNCETAVSRLSQWRLFCTLNPEASNKYTSYRDFKSKLVPRAELITRTRSLLTNGQPWIPTCSDDFNTC